jgi:hypothetical protein
VFFIGNELCLAQCNLLVAALGKSGEVEKHLQAHFQGRGKSADVDQRGFAFPAYDTTALGAVQAAAVSELFLGDSQVPAQLAHAIAESSSQVIGRLSMVFI